jgi:hypothetical protein
MNLGSIRRCSVRPHLAGDFFAPGLGTSTKAGVPHLEAFYSSIGRCQFFVLEFSFGGLSRIAMRRWLSSFAQATINTRTLRNQHSHSLNSKYLIGAGQCTRMISCIEFLLAAAP